jgi:PPOX class probable F420-dependent enzyme
MVTPDLASLADAECIKLVTFRKSGAEVATPVWFVVTEGRIFVRTLAHFGKLKRLRNNPRVRFAACDWDGEVSGPWFHARAELIPPADDRIPAVERLLDTRYGERRAEMNRLVELQGFETVFIAITPSGAA